MQTISYGPEGFSKTVYVGDGTTGADGIPSDNGRGTADHIPLPLIVSNKIIIDIDYLLGEKSTEQPEYAEYAEKKAKKAKKKKKAQKNAKKKENKK